MPEPDPEAAVAWVVALGLESLSSSSARPTSAPPAVVPAGAMDAELFASHVAQQRVSGLVLAAIDSGAYVDRRHELRRLVEAVHLEALRTSLAAEAASIDVHGVLERSGVRHAFLKGCATSQLDYHDPALRVTGDVDVLVARHDRTVALDALLGSGLQRIEPPFRDGWERRYGKDIPLIGDGRIEVDLHLALDAGYFGIAMCTPDLLEHRQHYQAGGISLPALDPIGRLLHAAIHTASSTPIRLGSAADVIRIADRDEFALDDFVTRATDLGCDGLVANGVVRAWSAFGTPSTPLSEWARRHHADLAQLRAMRRLTSSTGESRWITGINAVPWHRRPGYLLPLLLPSREYLAHRDRSAVGHLRISASRLRNG